MAPKKGAHPPPSDESSDDYEEPVEKKKKPATTAPKPAAEKKSRKHGKDGESEAPRQNPNDSLIDDPEEDLLNVEIEDIPQIDKSTYSYEKGRLMIYKIDCHNFKSYYGSTTIGPFHKNFSSIIGPNGSGKSNVIDSLLFVFGFRSGKIRSKKISNLIHNSAGKKCDNCTVGISFQRIRDKPGDHYDVIPGSQFTISRTAYQNNSSSYAIDGRIAPLKEVEAKLKEGGIDLVHNRFLILQGEVEAIAMMKPKGVARNEEGMLEYLEDIIGSNRFVKIIKKLELRVDRLSAEVSQQKIRRETARTVKEALEPDVRSAVDFLNKENAATMLRSKIEQLRRLRMMDKIQPTEKKLEEKREEMKEIAGKLDVNKQENKNNDKMDKELAKEKTKIEEEFDQVKQSIEDDETEEKKRKQNLKRINGEIEKMEAEKVKEEKKKETLVEAPAKAAKKIEKLKAESISLKEIEKTANEEADKNLAVFEERSQQYQEGKSAAEKEFAETNTKLNEIKSKTSVAQAELSDLKKLANKGKATLEELKAKFTEGERRLREEEEELKEVAPKLEKDNGMFEEYLKKVPEMDARKRNLEQKVYDLNSKINDMVTDQVRQNTGNSVLQAMVTEQQNGRLKGFIGRIGDLGAIDSKYDMAISSNFGQLNEYAVLTDTDGQEAIEFLIRRRLGRGRFHSMNQIKERPGMNKPANNFPLPRMFDLIKCDAKFKVLFYSIVGDVMVAENLKQAQELSRKYRYFSFVTLDGSKLTNDGSITGGGQPKKGFMGSEQAVRRRNSTENGNKMARMKGDLDEASDELRELTQKFNEANGRLSELRQSVLKLKERKKYLLMSIETGKSKVATLRKTIESQEKEVANCHVDPKDIEEKQRICDELTRERDEAAEKATSSKEKVDEIEGKIDAIFNELVGRFKSEAADALNKWQGIEKTIAKETGAINNSERNIAKCDDRIGQLEKDIEKRKDSLEKLEEVAINDEGLEERKAKLKEFEEKLKQIEEKFKEMREQKSSLSKEELDLEKRLEDVSNEVQGLKFKLEERKKKVDEIEGNISKFRLNKVPRLAFLNPMNRPEDLRIEVDDEEMERMNEFEDEEELDKIRKKAMNEITDQVYSLEYRMRKEKEENEEFIDECLDAPDRVPILSEKELREISEDRLDEMQFHRKTYEQQLEAMKGKVNLSVVEEYIEKVNRFNCEIKNTQKVMDVHFEHWSRLTMFKRKRLQEFDDGFRFIADAVKQAYCSLAAGGDADLQFKSGSDPFSEGISFMVRPPKKAWKQIENLSGGEKTLSSLALVFALHNYRPTPFYVMDEIDAALDYKNVTIIGEFVKDKKSNNAQFIIISLRNNMFELANRLVGIYKVDDCTQNVAIDPLAIAKCAKRLAELLGKYCNVMPEEVTAEFMKLKEQMSKKNIDNEKHYKNFPSTSDINRAEKILELEDKCRKVLNQRDGQNTTVQNGSTAVRVPSAASSVRPISQASSRPGSRLLDRNLRFQNVRLVRASEEPRPMTSSSRHNSASREESPADTPPAKRRASEHSRIEEESAENVETVEKEKVPEIAENETSQRANVDENTMV